MPTSNEIHHTPATSTTTSAPTTSATVVTDGRAVSPTPDEVVVPSAPAHGDRVRWGPVWAGALTVLATFLVLQLLFFALGWLDLAVTPPSAVVESVVSGVLALVAFLLGGLVTGVTLTRNGGRSDGLLNGMLVWALSVTIFLVGGLVGAGALVGPLGQFTSLAGGVVTAADVATIRMTAGWVVLGFVLAAVVASLGAAWGAGARRGARTAGSGR